MRVLAVLSILLLAFSVFAMGATDGAASTDAQASAVEAAVGSAVQASAQPASTSATPVASPGFMDSRLNDIQQRVAPMGQGFGNGQGGPAFGGGNGGGQGFGPQGGFGGNGMPGFGPNGGGPGQGNGGGVGPNGPGQGFGNGPGNNPGDFGGNGGFGPQGGPGFGPGPQGGGYGGPMNFRDFGQFNLPPDAIEGMIFSQIGETLDQKYGKDKLLAQCNDQPALVNLIMDEFQKTGTDLNKQVCSQMEQGLAFCKDAQSQCEQIGQPQGGPGFGPGPDGQPGQDGEKPFVPTCPPDQSQLTSACKDRMQSQMAQESTQRAADIDDQCALQWEYQKGNGQNCQNGQMQQPDVCSHDAFVASCIQRQPQDGGFGPQGQPNGPGFGPNGPQGQQPWQQPQNPQPQQPWMPPQGQGGPQNNGPGQNGQPGFQNGQPPSQNQCPPVDEAAKNACLANGQAWTTQGGQNGCPTIVCTGPSQNSPAPTAQSTPTLENPAPTATPTQSASVQPTAAPTVASTPAPTAAATTTSANASSWSEWRLDDGQNGANGNSGPQGNPAFMPGQGGFGPQTGPDFGNGGPGVAGNRPSASDRCEQEWQRNSARFAQQCAQMSRNGPQLDVCNQDNFMTQCKAQMQKRMADDAARLDLDKICAIQTRQQMRQLTRYCQDTTQGKARCLSETKKGCDFGQQQLEKCQQLTTADNVRKAIENAVARQCRLQSGSGSVSGLNKLAELVPTDFKSLVNNEADNVQSAQDTAKKVDQKDAGYALTQLLGMQADQEKKDAVALQEQSDRLGKTIERLQALTDQVDGADAKAILQAQILDLQQQKDTLDAHAKSKAQGANGIFGILAGLLGGGK